MPNQKTIPRVLASEVDCDYDEIDIALEEREKRGIARNYQELGEQERDRVYAVREEYMVENLFRVDDRNAQVNRLRSKHVKGMQPRRTEHGERLTARDLTKEDWVLEIYREKEELLLDRRGRR
jgi:hypothetical protein